MNVAEPSITAAVVASTLLLHDGDDVLAPLVDRGAVPQIERAVRETIPIFGRLLDSVPRPLLRHAAYAVERVLSPGFMAHYALRKHAVRGAVLRAIEEGARQVVLLGAGLDMLARSLPEGVTIFEIDTEGTQRVRRAVAQRELVFVTVDLGRERIASALEATGAFDPSLATVYVAEGLLMYLAPERVDALLEDIARGTGRTHVVLTMMTPDSGGRMRLHSQRRVVDWCMRWLDEPFVFGERRERIPSLLGRFGFEVDSVVSTHELRDRLFREDARSRLPRPTGEIIVVAKK